MQRRKPEVRAVDLVEEPGFAKSGISFYKNAQGAGSRASALIFWPFAGRAADRPRSPGKRVVGGMPDRRPKEEKSLIGVHRTARKRNLAPVLF